MKTKNESQPILMMNSNILGNQHVVCRRSKVGLRNVIISVLILALIAAPIIANVGGVKEVRGLSRACQNSPECMSAVAKEQEANKNAANASRTANAFQSKVYELNAEIARKELEIAETTAQVEDLKKQIEETEKKLNAEQEALVELLVNMHFEGDAEPITILAGASSISDLAEKQARSEVVKQQISATAAKVKAAKEKLEADKAQVEQLLEQQKAAKQELVVARAEQQDLVNKYQNDAASYEAVAKAAQEAAREAERREQEAHPELYRGSSYTGANTYPWQEDCPHKQDYYLTYWDDAWGTHKIGGYVCECVSYAGWKAYEAFGISIGWGNAYSWDDVARNLGYRVDNEPAANTIGQADGGQWGHVFWVESVNYDGSINVTEYNNAYATYLYSGNSHYGDFGSRKIGAGEVWQYNFIHLD